MYKFLTVLFVLVLLNLSTSVALTYKGSVAKSERANGPASSNSNCAQPKFDTAQILKSVGGSKDSAIGDFDRDGNLDIVTTFEVPQSRGFSIFRGLGGRRFAGREDIHFPSTFDIAERVYIDDLNDDGWPDLAVATTFANRILVFRNTTVKAGSISFAPGQQVIIGGDAPRSLAIVDLDGDEFPEVIASHNSTSSSGPVVTVLGNISSSGGEISFLPQFLPRGLASNFVTSEDIDGDGRSDLVVGGANRTEVYRNTSEGPGNITFETPVLLDSRNSVRGIITTDIDQDNRPDIAVIGSDNLILFRNTGAGPGNLSFAQRQVVTGFNALWSIVSGDYDGDSTPDLAVINNPSNSIGVLRNISTPGSIAFANRNVEFGAGVQPYNLDTADIDGDSRLDLVVANLNEGSVWILWNTSTGSGDVNFVGRKDHLTYVGAEVTGLGAADFDGDGLKDVVATFDESANAFGFSVYRNNGRYFGATPYFFSTQFEEPEKVAVGDLDNDGKEEIVTQSKNAMFVFRNTSSNVGEISFFFARGIYISGRPGGVYIEDLDGDGKRDLIAIHRHIFGADFERAVYYRNISPGVGSYVFDFPVDLNLDLSSLNLSFADIDLDGKTDILTPVGSAAGAMRIFRNIGTAPGEVAFSPLDVSVAGSSEIHRVIVGDLDGDAKLELVSDVTLIGTSNRRIAVNRNVSEPGSLVFENAFLLSPLFPLSPLAIRDLNGDGKSDLISRRVFSDFPLVEVWQNLTLSGKDILLEPVGAVATGGSDEVIVDDLDNDGNSDIVGGKSVSRGIVSVLYSSVCTQRSNQFDFDGDGKTDVSVFRPVGGSGSEWWYLRSSDGGNRAFAFGEGADTIVPADFTGDGKTDLAFWRPASGEWFVLRSEDSTFFAFPFGATGDVPAPADFDGDGKSDATVYRPSTNTWFTLRSSDGQVAATPFGTAGDKPVPGDYDGDGKADVAIFRPTGGSGGGEWWYLRSSDGANRAFAFGTSTDLTVPGDYTGDGKADIAYFRPSTGEWFILRSEDSSFFAFPWGASGDLPAPGDYDGDGRIDAAVFRPSNSNWFALRSTAGPLILQFGTTGDRPLPNAFVR